MRKEVGKRTNRSGSGVFVSGRKLMFGVDIELWLLSGW